MIPLITQKQREVIALLAQGYTKPDIADTLGISLEAVNTRMVTARKNTGTRTAAQLVAWAIDHGELAKETTTA
jgi:DNA-binding CsgD family transcriptional regulator